MYRARRPFHPERLMSFITDKLGNDDDDEEDEDEEEGEVKEDGKQSRVSTTPTAALVSSGEKKRNGHNLPLWKLPYPNPSCLTPNPF